MHESSEVCLPLAPAVSAGVAVLGGGGHAAVVISALREAGLSVAAVYDDDPRKWGTKLLGAPVIGAIRGALISENCRSVIGLGDNSKRREIADLIPCAEWVTVIHPKAYVHPSVCLGLGSVVFAGAIIQPGVRIGRHCIINTGATVDHHCDIADFCHVAPGCNLGGAATLGEGVFVGIGSAVIQNTKVGAWTTVGAGAAVVADLPDRAVAVGVPARVRRRLNL